MLMFMLFNLSTTFCWITYFIFGIIVIIILSPSLDNIILFSVVCLSWFSSYHSHPIACILYKIFCNCFLMFFRLNVSLGNIQFIQNDISFIGQGSTERHLEYKRPTLAQISSITLPIYLAFYKLLYIYESQFPNSKDGVIIAVTHSCLQTNQDQMLEAYRRMTRPE